MEEIKMYKNLTILLSLVLITISSNSQACSLSIEEDLVLNDMLAAVANRHRIPLIRATKLKGENFSYRLFGDHPTSSCENNLEFTALITIEYKPNLFEKCTLIAQTVHTFYLNATEPPFFDIETEPLEASCKKVPVPNIPTRTTRPTPPRVRGL